MYIINSKSLVFHKSKIGLDNNFSIFYFQEDLKKCYLFNIIQKRINNMLFNSSKERSVYLLLELDLLCFLEKNIKMKIIYFNRNFNRRSYLLSQEIFKGFCIEFRIFGLGFRILRSSKVLTKNLILDLGYSHFIYLKLPPKMILKTLKRRFILIGYSFQILNIVLKQIKLLKGLTPYKLRGLSLSKEIYKAKPGKKQKRK